MKLTEINEALSKLDPLAGPNILRTADHYFINNGDGTMTMKPRRPYVDNFPPDWVKNRQKVPENTG